MTSDIGKITVYNENDLNKDKYLKNINKGDLVFFHTKSLDDNSPTPTNNYPGHVGIYLGNNQFIHASYEKEKVVIDNLDNNWLEILVASSDFITNIIN